MRIIFMKNEIEIIFVKPFCCSPVEISYVVQLYSEPLWSGLIEGRLANSQLVVPACTNATVG